MIQDDPEAPICQPEESRIPVITSTTFLPANNLSRSERDFFFLSEDSFKTRCGSFWRLSIPAFQVIFPWYRSSHLGSPGPSFLLRLISTQVWLKMGILEKTLECYE